MARGQKNPAHQKLNENYPWQFPKQAEQEVMQGTLGTLDLGFPNLGILDEIGFVWPRDAGLDSGDMWRHARPMDPGAQEIGSTAPNSTR